MINKKELYKLYPKRENPFAEFEWDEFYDSFKNYFPNFPKDVIKQWPYRHFKDFVEGEYWNFGYEKFSFQLVEFDNNQIDDIKSKIVESDLISTGLVHLHDDEYLANYIRENLTFPVPIIVLDVENSVNIGDMFEGPYYLLEGHRRLWLMKALYRSEVDGIPNTHKVWLAKICRE